MSLAYYIENLSKRPDLKEYIAKNWGGGCESPEHFTAIEKEGLLFVYSCQRHCNIHCSVEEIESSVNGLFEGLKVTHLSAVEKLELLKGHRFTSARYANGYIRGLTFIGKEIGRIEQIVVDMEENARLYFSFDKKISISAKEYDRRKRNLIKEEIRKMRSGKNRN